MPFRILKGEMRLRRNTREALYIIIYFLFYKHLKVMWKLFAFAFLVWKWDDIFILQMF